jgi:hypothetical protein
VGEVSRVRVDTESKEDKDASVSGITDDMRAQMQEINANLGHARRCSSSTRFFAHDGEEVVEIERPSIVKNHSMFPYYSSQMGVQDLADIPKVVQQLKSEGLFPEFDDQGRIKIESTKHCDAVAKALEMKTGRDGYGHLDQYGNFQNSGRRRADEIAEGRSKVQRAIRELNEMPEEMPAHAVRDALAEYDIGPTEDNTG